MSQSAEEFANEFAKAAQEIEQTPMPDSARAKARALFHRIGNWGTANVLKKNQAFQNLALAKQLGDGNVSSEFVNKVLEDVPFGSEVNINTITMGGGSAAQPPETEPTPEPEPEPVTPRPPQVPSTGNGATPMPGPITPPPVTPPTNPPVTVPSNGNGKKWGAGTLATAALGAATLGLGLGSLPVWWKQAEEKPVPGVVQPAPPLPAKPLIYDGEIELELGLDVERTRSSSSSIRSSGATGTTGRSTTN